MAKKIPEWEWKTFAGNTHNKQIHLHQKATVEETRTIILEVPKPNVWAIDGSGDDAGPKDKALTKACKQFVQEVTAGKATLRSRVDSMYRLIEKYKELNNGTGDTFVREAFYPWIENAGIATSVWAMAIWHEIMEGAS